MPKTTVRPGYVIRDVLTRRQPVLNIKTSVRGGVPVYTEELVDAASIQDLHRTYKLLIRIEKQNSVTPILQRPMGRDSFGKYIYFGKRLGFLELDSEEDADFPEGRTTLLQIEGNVDADDIVLPEERTVIESKRLLYRLTPVGLSATSQWDDLGKAYRSTLR